MALDYVSLSLNITNYYDSLKTDTQQDNPEQVPYPKDPVNPPGTWLIEPVYDEFETLITPGVPLPEDKWISNYIIAYDNDANNGIFTAPSVVMVNKPELLIFIANSVCSGPDMLAAKISEYWQAQLTPGTPISGGIQNITNDAAKIQAPIENYLCTLGTMTETTPYYEHLFQFIELQVKTIIWTVTESLSTYTVTIT